MDTGTLSEIEASIAALDLADQVRLLQYLTPRIAGAVLASRPNLAHGEQAWLAYRALGRRLAATSTVEAASLTDAVSQSKR